MPALCYNVNYQFIFTYLGDLSMQRLTNSLKDLFHLCRNSSSNPDQIIALLDRIKYLDYPYFSNTGSSIAINQEILNKLILDIIQIADLHNPKAENLLSANYYLYTPEATITPIETEVRNIPQLVSQLKELYRLHCVALENHLGFIQNRVDRLVEDIVNRPRDGLEPNEVNKMMNSALNVAYITSGNEGSVELLLEYAA